MVDLYEEKNFLSGKRDFWIYVALVVMLELVVAIASASVDVSDYIADIIFIFLLYHGYIWVWYLKVVDWGLALLYVFIEAVTMVPEVHWMLHACPHKILLMVMMVTITIAVNIFLTFKKKLKYFVKIKQLKRKGMLDMDKSKNSGG